MRSFQRSIEQMLWPEKRERDAVLGDKIPGKIDRITGSGPGLAASLPPVPAYIRIAKGYLPGPVRISLGLTRRLFPNLLDADGVPGRWRERDGFAYLTGREPHTLLVRDTPIRRLERRPRPGAWEPVQWSSTHQSDILKRYE